MSELFNRDALRDLVREVVREVLAEERRTKPDESTYVSTVEAARLADVCTVTIRRWITAGDLTAYRAGRQLRVSRSQLHDVLARGGRASRSTMSPEALAERAFERRAKKGA